MAQENTDARSIIERSKRILRERKDAEESEQLLEKLPQGHGSGLNADTVDGLHAAEIMARAPGKGGGGGGSGGGTEVHGNEKHDPTMVTEAGHTKTLHDALGIDAATLQGSSKAEVQDHAPKAHANEAHSTQMATVEELATHEALPNVHHRKFNWYDEWTWGHVALLPLSTTAPSWRRIGVICPKAGSNCTSLGNPGAVYCKEDKRVHVYHHNIAGDAGGQGIIHWYSGEDDWETPYTKDGKVLALGAPGSDDSAYLLCPRVMIDYYETDPDKKFKMFYEGYDGAVYRLLWASSPDGYTWTKQGRCTITGAVPYNRFSLTPLQLGAMYLGYYCSAIGGSWETYMAYSADGIAWVYVKKVIAVGAAGQWDDSTAVYPSSMYLMGCHYVLYSGRNASSGKYQMGIVTSTDGYYGTDGGATYRKWFLNPAIDNQAWGPTGANVLQGWLFGWEDNVYCICNENVPGDVGNYQIALYKLV